MILLTKPICEHTDAELVRAGLTLTELYAVSPEPRYLALVNQIDAELIARMKASNPYGQNSNGISESGERALNAR
jgi:hypothetical protein